MKYIFAITFLAVTSLISAQDDFHVYDWEELGSCDPDTVYGISFRKSKLDSIPTDLIKFSNVRYLDFEKNKITEIPQFFEQFNKLEYLNLGKNELTHFPSSLCNSSSLKTLLLHVNDIAYLPPCVEGFTSLQNLDLFKNPIGSLPEELTQLKQLAILELRSIKFSPEFQEKWIDLLPNTKIMFDPPCDCMR